MDISQLKHADDVGLMFAERSGDTEELFHYGVPGMKWGVRKEKESSGNGRKSGSSKSTTKRVSNKNKNANDYVSNKKRVSTGAKVVTAIVAGMVLRKNVSSIAGAIGKNSAKLAKYTSKYTNKYASKYANKYATKYELKRLKQLKKLEAKYGPDAVKDLAKRNYNKIKVNGYGAKSAKDAALEGAKKGAEKGAKLAAAKAGEKGAKAAVTNAVKNVASVGAENKRIESQAVTKATKKANQVSDNAKRLREARKNYKQQTKKLAKEAETKARNTIEKLEHDKKMEKLRAKRANRLKQTWSPYEDTIKGLKTDAKYRKQGTSLKAVNKQKKATAKTQKKTAKATAKTQKKTAKATAKAQRKAEIKKSWEDYEMQQKRETAAAIEAKQKKKSTKTYQKSMKKLNKLSGK